MKEEKKDRGRGRGRERGRERGIERERKRDREREREREKKKERKQRKEGKTERGETRRDAKGVRKSRNNEQKLCTAREEILRIIEVNPALMAPSSTNKGFCHQDSCGRSCVELLPFD